MRDLVATLRTEAVEMRKRDVLPADPMFNGLWMAMMLVAERYDQAADEIERLRGEKASEDKREEAHRG